MSVSDQSGQHNGSRTAPSGADDVRDLLKQLAGQIAGQIADVDRRHADAMRDMESRMGALGGQAQRAKAQLAEVDTTAQHRPHAEPEVRHSLDRIEAGMATLKAQVAATADQRETRTPLINAGATSADEWDMASAEALTRIYEVEGQPSDYFFMDPPAPAPAPVQVRPTPVKMAPQSIAAPAVATTPARPTPKSAPVLEAPQNEAVNHDPLVAAPEITAPNHTVLRMPEPPQPAAAVAPLVRPLVQSMAAAAVAPAVVSSVIAAAPAMAMMAAMPVQAPAPEIVRPEVIHVDPSPAILAALAENRDWLDARLAELAERVDRTLATADPEAGFTHLNTRLDTLEEHFGTAFEALATRADIAALKDIEQQIGALQEAFTDTRQQLGRLDEIELQLRELTQFASAAASEPAPMADFAPPVEMPDLEALVSSTAERVAQKFADTRSLPAIMEPAPGAATRENVEQLQTMLDAYMQERRREEGQTASTLETMQEALVRLIDRFDQLEQAGNAEADDLTTAQASQFATNPVQAQGAYAEPAPRYIEVADERSAAADRRKAERPARAAPPYEPVAAAPDLHDNEPETAPAATRGPRRPALKVTTDTDSAEAPAEAPAARGGPSKIRSQITKEKPSSNRKVVGLAVIGIAAIAIGIATFYAVPGLTGATVTASAPPAAAPAVAQPRQQRGDPMAVTTAPGAGPALASPRTQDQRPQPASAQPGAPERPSGPQPRTAPEPGRGVDTPAGAPPPRGRPVSELTQDQGPADQADAGPRPNFVEALGGGRITTAALNGIMLDQTSQPAQQLAARNQPLTTAAINAPDAAIERAGAVEMPPALIGPLSLRLAAQKGDPGAQFEIGARFAEAKGVKQDFQQALVWYQRSAQKGFVPSQYRLAALYERGLGTQADPARARAWYSRAASLGNTKAMHNLAVLSANPEQANPDYATAAKWFGEAAERGVPDSQYNLAVLHESGLGVPQDLNQAYKWFALAARSGDAEAIKRRDQLLASFTPDDARRAQAQVAQWRSKPTELKANDPRIAGDAWKAEQEALNMRAMAAEYEKFQQQQAQQQQPQKPAGASTPAATKTAADTQPKPKAKVQAPQIPQ